MPKCLVCFDDIQGPADAPYHRACAKRLFGNARPPELDYDPARLQEMGLSALKAGQGITGVQKKLSMGFENSGSRRLTIVGFKGSFILKPQSDDYSALPENEAFCMELARRSRIPAAEHGLMRDRSGAFSYVSRRFDRAQEGMKLHQEDFCQISMRPSSDKYKGSLEAAAKCLRHSNQTGLDVVRFLELNLFCWLSGNADMHLKNFSLLNTAPGRWELSPAYDLLSTTLVLNADREETALTVNGKKSKLRRSDWEAFASSIGVSGKVFASSAEGLCADTNAVAALCDASYLPEVQKTSFMETWKERAGRLGEKNAS
jgi:serine/threonine-protein kinase HipA